MTQYKSLNSPPKIQIIEIGPGKGTLICDMIRSAVDTFPDFAMALSNPTTSKEGKATEVGQGEEKRTTNVAIGVHLVEVVNGMRAKQKESLQNLMKEKGMQEKRYSFIFANENSSFPSGNNEKEESETRSWLTNNKKEEQSPQNTIHFSWHNDLSTVPTHDAITQKPIPTFIICQEILDALPIHSFQKVQGNVWRERLVDVAIQDEAEAGHAREDILLAMSRVKKHTNTKVFNDSNIPYMALAPSSSNIVPGSSAPHPKANCTKNKLPRLRFVLPPDTTPALRTILRVDNSGAPTSDNPMAQSLNSLPVGSIVEACPEALLLVQDVADRITAAGGAALVVDYGEDGSSGGDTLRAFRKHEQVHPLSLPGETDVTADVDFGAARESVNARVRLEESLARERKEEGGVRSRVSAGLTVKQNIVVDTCHDSDKRQTTAYAFGPISQGRFLAQMGVVERATKKIEDDATTDEEAEEIYSALERLMATEEMGERYKVLAIAHKKQGLFPPPGF